MNESSYTETSIAGPFGLWASQIRERKKPLQRVVWYPLVWLVFTLSLALSPAAGHADNGQALPLAADAGDLQKVNTLLDKDVDIN